MKIIRSQRRTIGLQIAPDATLIIRAPFRVSDSAIARLVARKYDWIVRKQEFVRCLNRLMPAKKFIPGEEFLYLGQAYKLHIQPDQSAPLVFDRAFHLAQDCRGQARQRFIQWYREQTRTRITGRVEFQASRAGLRYKKIRISGARSRWGSCSRAGNLNFSWRLVMAPPDVIDYVVVHEVAHLAHPNHSRAFWNQVLALDPDYKQRRKWLRDNGHLLEL